MVGVVQAAGVPGECGAELADLAEPAAAGGTVRDREDAVAAVEAAR